MEPIYEGCWVLLCTQSSIRTLGLRSWCEQGYQLQLMLRETTHLASCGRRFTKYLSYFCEPDTAHGTEGTAINSCHHEAYLLVVLVTLNWNFFRLECSYDIWPIPKFSLGSDSPHPTVVISKMVWE